jgi:sulfur carrier protein
VAVWDVKQAMNLILNGTETEVGSLQTVADLLQHLNLDPQQVVVELNQKIIRRNQVSEVCVQAHDHVEILRFVGGG